MSGKDRTGKNSHRATLVAVDRSRQDVDSLVGSAEQRQGRLISSIFIDEQNPPRAVN
jgi:hypothetical protein